jgi:predicted ester cyclase
LDSLVPSDGIPPRGMRVSFSVKKLKKRYSKRKILMASPIELHEMLDRNNGSK